MFERGTLTCHEFAPEVGFGGKRIMRSAAYRHIGLRVRSTPSEGFDMVKLEPVRFAATLTASIDIAAPRAIALEHRAAYSGRHVTPALALRAPRINMIDFDHLARGIETRA